ncbi:MAG: hypothetical protein HY293_08710 [Planctomycetes bacterium]|nr:hypothetical protein [Planctomycetota bacterium]
MLSFLAAAVLLACPALQAVQDGKKPAPAPQEEKKPEEKPPPPQEPAASEPWLIDLQGDLRIGGWRTGTFNSFTAAGRRKIESTLLFDVGFDVRAVYSGWSLMLTGDHAVGKSITQEMGGILVGAEIALESEPLPLDLQIAAGPILGRLDVDVAGFGGFDSAVGFELRVCATSWLHERVGLSFWLDFRQITFKYDEPVTSGDKSAGGPSFALGLGLVMRF